MPKKRYTRRDAEMLFARLMQYAEAGAAASEAEGRALFSTLLDARFGDFLVGDNAREELRDWTSERVIERAKSMSLFFRMFYVPTGFDTQVGPVWMRPIPDVGIRIDGAAADVLTFQEINLLRLAKIRHLPVCECGRLFVRVGRQEFCSERCQKRVYMRLRREEEKREKKGLRRGKTTRTR